MPSPRFKPSIFSKVILADTERMDGEDVLRVGVEGPVRRLWRQRRPKVTVLELER